VYPELAARFDSEAAEFHQALATGRPDAVAAARTLAITTERMTNALAARKFTSADEWAVLRRLTAEPETPLTGDAGGARQLYWAIRILSDDLAASGRLTDTKRSEIASATAAMRAAIRDGAAFNQRDMTEPLLRIRHVVGGAT
jgi:hypothetical protein